MREAIGSSLIFNLVVVFVVIMIAFLVGSLSYSKAYKAKNRIIDIIEKHDGYNTDAKDEISSDLAKVGYQVAYMSDCDPQNLNDTTYNYCVYRVCTKTDASGNCKGNIYYQVETFMHFDIPIIGEALDFGVSGETKYIGRNYDNIEE